MKSLGDKGIHGCIEPALTRTGSGIADPARAARLHTQANFQRYLRSFRYGLTNLLGVKCRRPIQPAAHLSNLQFILVRSRLVRVRRNGQRNLRICLEKLKLELFPADSYDYDLAFCIRVISPTPRAMSRQAGPSIVLSVLIVCFFAVALFQRDLPRARAPDAGDRRARESVARTFAPTPGGRTQSAKARDRKPHTSRVTVQSKMSSMPGEHSIFTSAKRVPAAAADSRPLDSRTGRSEQPVALGSDRPGSRVPEVSARAKGRMQQPASTGLPRKPDSARSPRSAFTTARESETIEDVSSRVYGTPEHGELLWRANRDTLPKRNSPLARGMLLRTPSVR